MKNVPTIFTSDIKGEHDSINQIAYLKKFTAPFHGWDSTISRIKATARKHFFTGKSFGVTSTYLVDLGRMKD